MCGVGQKLLVVVVVEPEEEESYEREWPNALLMVLPHRAPQVGYTLRWDDYKFVTHKT